MSYKELNEIFPVKVYVDVEELAGDPTSPNNCIGVKSLRKALLQKGVKEGRIKNKEGRPVLTSLGWGTIDGTCLIQGRMRRLSTVEGINLNALKKPREVTFCLKPYFTDDKPTNQTNDH